MFHPASDCPNPFGMFSNLGLKTADERLRGFLYLADNLPRSKRFAGLLDNRLGNLIL
jgi:hypothetical protein